MAEPPSGRQFEIACGEQRAWVVEVGGGIRRYVSGGRDVLDGYAEDAVCTSGRGQCLIPWPNRVAGGSYEFGGQRQQLALTEPTAGNAIHGLVRWANWQPTDHRDDRVALTYLLHPRPGYPHTLQLSLDYRLAAGGLTVRTTATNIGIAPCPFGAGAHPYLTFDRSPVDEVTLRVPAGTRLLSDGKGIPTGAAPVEGTSFDFREPRPIGALQLDTAYTDLERDTDGRARIVLASGDGRATTVWLDEHYSHVMVFSGDPLPDVARRSLAVEPMTCAPNAFRGGDGLLTLDPGASFTAEWGIEPA
ncbi:MAG TPA: aldose 1-epimerase family protein [Gaiellaceae bacterium]